MMMEALTGGGYQFPQRCVRVREKGSGDEVVGGRGLGLRNLPPRKSAAVGTVKQKNLTDRDRCDGDV